MSKDLDKANTWAVLQGNEPVRACVNCKHYSKSIAESAKCRRHLRQGFHPVTGKHGWIGELTSCDRERKIDDWPTDKDNCGKEGQYFVRKQKFNWLKWFKKDA